MFTRLLSMLTNNYINVTQKVQFWPILLSIKVLCGHHRDSYCDSPSLLSGHPHMAEKRKMRRMVTVIGICNSAKGCIIHS